MFPSCICSFSVSTSSRCLNWSQRAITRGSNTPNHLTSVYLSPRAVVAVGVKGHRLRVELLDGRVILIQQRCGHLVGAPAVAPAAVPAGWVSVSGASDAFRDTWASPVLHDDGGLSIQLFSSEAFSDQIDHLPLQAQPTTQVIESCDSSGRRCHAPFI